MRLIPSTLATQHPDNASAPYWEKDGDGFVNVAEEIEECVSCFKDLNTDEYMWDWEGKYADEAVIDKLFAKYHDYFKKNQLGKDRFLTFRLPNIDHEKSYSLIRALTVVLTSEDFARDLGFFAPPLFEVILPMVERAEQLMYIQRSFEKLAKFKTQIFNHTKHRHATHLDVIPLVESVQNQINIGRLLRAYFDAHKKYFGFTPAYVRPFLARSDPALLSGLIATVLGNKIALSEIEEFSLEKKVKCYPIIGVGSLIFRGGLNPENINSFLKQYQGVRTVTVQSAFRYDYPLHQVKKAVSALNQRLKNSRMEIIPEKEKSRLKKIIARFASLYQTTVQSIVPDLESVFSAVPKRRERKLHIGLLAYGRRLGKFKLPRAIGFTAGFYSLGIPPEFIGAGRALIELSEADKALLQRYYFDLEGELRRAGYFLNKENLAVLAKTNSHWNGVIQDIKCLESYFGCEFGPKNTDHWLHKNLSANALILRHNSDKLKKLIIETGILRKSLG